MLLADKALARFAPSKSSVSNDLSLFAAHNIQAHDYECINDFCCAASGEVWASEA